MPDDIDDDIEDYRRYGLITKIFHHGIDDAKFDSVSTDEQSITDGDGPSIIYRDGNGNLTTENYSTIQSAVDNYPTTSDDAATGMLYVPSKGGIDGGYTEAVDLPVDPLGGRVVGSGIHCKIENNDSSVPVIDFGMEDGELGWFWLNNHDGPVVFTGSAGSYIHHINIDEAGTFAIDAGANTRIETLKIKRGDAAAIRLRGGHNFVDTAYIHQEFDGDTINEGIRVEGGPNLIENVGITGTSDDNFIKAIYHKSGAEAYYSNIFGGESDQPQNSSGGGNRFIRCDGDNFYGTGLFEDGTFTTAGFTVNVDATSIRAQGAFPSGVEFTSDVTTAGGVIIEGEVGGITESTAGYKNGQIINGRSWNSGNPATGGIWNGNAALAASHDVTVIDVSGSSPLPRYEAQDDGSGGYEWVEQSITAA